MVPLRIAIGFGFAAHGYAKFSRGEEAFAAILAALNVPLPHLAAWATIIAELVGGISILAGAFVVFWSVPLAIVMLTAMLTVHLPYGFSSIKLKEVGPAGALFGPPGYEINLLYIAGLAALVLYGAGAVSVDGWLRARKIGRVT